MLDTLGFALMLAAWPWTGDAQVTPAGPAAYHGDVRCLAVVTIAESELPRADARRERVAAAYLALRARVDGYLANGDRDVVEIVSDLQAATNASRATFADELAGCLDRAGDAPGVRQADAA